MTFSKPAFCGFERPCTNLRCIQCHTNIYLHNEAKCKEAQDEVEDKLLGVAADDVHSLPIYCSSSIFLDRIFFTGDHVLDSEQTYDNWYRIPSIQGCAKKSLHI